MSEGLLDARETEQMLRKLNEEHPKYDGVGCENHVVCSEYEDERLLGLLRGKGIK